MVAIAYLAAILSSWQKLGMSATLVSSVDVDSTNEGLSIIVEHPDEADICVGQVAQEYRTCSK